MAEYTTKTLVSQELNALTIDASSTPTQSTVNGWIEESSAEVEQLTNQIWGTAIASSEYHDYDGSGVLRLNYKPVITISELLADSNGIDAASTGWYSLSEGRINTTDFRVYKEEAEVWFHGVQKPISGFQSLCASYTYGYADTPIIIQRITTLLVAKRVINSIISGSATNEGGRVSVGTITVGDPSNFGINRIGKLDSEIQMLYHKVGTLKTFRLDRRY